MKNTAGKVLSIAVGLSCFTVIAQNQPYLSVSNDSPNTAQITWTNDGGTTYRIFYTPDLTVPLTNWTPYEDAFSDDASVSAGISTKDSPNGFFIVKNPADSGVQIYSPTNNQIVSGAITIRAGAQTGSSLEGVNLFLDDALIGFVNAGGVAFYLDTTHFTNGLHTVYVSALNTANGQTASDPITLDFENPVRWYDAGSLFESFVPIDVESDIYPADWEIFVEDTNGVTVRTISGSTSDGNINTNWDGTDDNGDYMPDQASYKITVAVASGGFGGSSMMRSSRLSVGSRLSLSSDLTLASASQNAYGVTEYTVQEPAPDLTAAYSTYLESYANAPEDEKILFPPLPPMPTDAPTVITKKLSPLEMFMAEHQSKASSLSLGSSRMTPMDAGSGSGSTGSTSATLWRESGWSSGQIILARQKLSFFQELTYAATLNGLLHSIETWVEADDATGNRGTFTASTYVIPDSMSWSELQSDLASTSPNIRALYLYAHGSSDGNTFGGTVKAKDLGTLLGNSVVPSAGNKPAQVITHKPFSFVFLDGCDLGLGDFSDSFGIPKIVPSKDYEHNNMHKRAFMSWGGITSNSILDNSFLNWSLSFWKNWIESGSDTPLDYAVGQASSHYNVTNSAPIIIHGYEQLHWGD